VVLNKDGMQITLLRLKTPRDRRPSLAPSIGGGEALLLSAHFIIAFKPLNHE